MCVQSSHGPPICWERKKEKSLPLSELHHEEQHVQDLATHSSVLAAVHYTTLDSSYSYYTHTKREGEGRRRISTSNTTMATLLLLLLLFLCVSSILLCRLVWPSKENKMKSKSRRRRRRRRRRLRLRSCSSSLDWRAKHSSWLDSFLFSSRAVEFVLAWRYCYVFYYRRRRKERRSTAQHSTHTGRGVQAMLRLDF